MSSPRDWRLRLTYTDIMADVKLNVSFFFSIGHLVLCKYCEYCQFLGSIYFAILQGYAIFEKELWMFHKSLL